MDITLGFLGYLIAYRLSIIGVGGLSILLGYRLFCKGLYPQLEFEPTEFQAKIGDTEFSLTSAGPGLFFALFGVIIISIMIAQGHPELTLKKSSKETKAEPESVFRYENVPKATQGLSKKTQNQSQKIPDQPQLELTMRGNQETKGIIQQKIDKAIQMEREGKIDDAIDLYKEALFSTTPAMNGLAWLYATERNDKLSIAENLSNLSIQLNPNEANYWDTYAEILFRNKQYSDALSAKKKAADLDPSFNEGMEKYEKK